MAKSFLFYFKSTVVLCFILSSVLTFSDEISDTAQQKPPSKNSLELFNEGLQLFKAKDFQKAFSSFEKSAELDPKSESALMNLGITALELKKVGTSLAAFRKVLTINPTHHEALQGIQYIQHKFEIREIPHQIEFYQALREYFLASQSMNSYLTLFATLFLFFGIIMIRYWGSYKNSIAQEIAPPPFPYIGFFFGGLLVICISLLGAKFYDLTLQRGTIISSQVGVKTAPGEDQATLFDLYEGLEVVILHQSAGWLQVQYPGGLAGWIPQNSIMQTQ